MTTKAPTQVDYATMLEKLTSDAALCNQLCSILSEQIITNEGAVEVLQRIIQERDSVRRTLVNVQKVRPVRAQILAAVARGWCSAKNSGKIIDADLATAITEEVMTCINGTTPAKDFPADYTCNEASEFICHQADVDKPCICKCHKGTSEYLESTPVEPSVTTPPERCVAVVGGGTCALSHRHTHRMSGDDEPWPIADVLESLATAADHLMRHHSCDAHGYEAVSENAERARVLAARIRLSKSSIARGAVQPDSPEETDTIIRDNEIVEQYIRSLSWTSAASEDDKLLVAGNIRSFAAHVRLSQRPVTAEALWNAVIRAYILHVSFDDCEKIAAAIHEMEKA